MDDCGLNELMTVKWVRQFSETTGANFASRYGVGNGGACTHWTTLCLQKQYTWLLIITSPNVYRFSTFFHNQIPREILYTYIIMFVHHTLSMFHTNLKLQLLPISMAYCIWDLRIHLARYKAALIAQVWILWL